MLIDQAEGLYFRGRNCDHCDEAIDPGQDVFYARDNNKRAAHAYHVLCLLDLAAEFETERRPSEHELIASLQDLRDQFRSSNA